MTLEGDYIAMCPWPVGSHYWGVAALRSSTANYDSASNLPTVRHGATSVPIHRLVLVLRHGCGTMQNYKQITKHLVELSFCWHWSEVPHLCQNINSLETLLLYLIKRYLVPTGNNWTGTPVAKSVSATALPLIYILESADRQTDVQHLISALPILKRGPEKQSGNGWIRSKMTACYWYVFLSAIRWNQLKWSSHRAYRNTPNKRPLGGNMTVSSIARGHSSIWGDSMPESEALMGIFVGGLWHLVE